MTNFNIDSFALDLMRKVWEIANRDGPDSQRKAQIQVEIAEAVGPLMTKQAKEPVALRYTNDRALAECPCCGSLDVGGVHDTVNCYRCGLTITKKPPLKNAIDAWNKRALYTVPQAQPAPIPTSERLPTDDDFDCFGKIWCYFGDIAEWEIVQRDGDGKAYMFSDCWLPTGLTMPPSPTNKEQSNAKNTD